MGSANRIRHSTKSCRTGSGVRCFSGATSSPSGACSPPQLTSTSSSHVPVSLVEDSTMVVGAVEGEKTGSGVVEEFGMGFDV